jgi:double-strand break repair protein MRE11
VLKQTGHRQVAILQIQNREFNIEPIPLRSVRPFIMGEVMLAEEQEVNNVKLDTKKDANKFLRSKVPLFLSSVESYVSDCEIQVEELIERAREQWLSLHEEDEEMLLPLIRLKVCTSLTTS